MRIVGTNHGGYANERNIAGLPMQRYRVVRCRNAFRGPNYLHFKLRGKMHAYYPWLHWDAGFANYDLLHFFNGISLGHKPWLSTFETFLPRWASYGGKRIDWGLRHLAGDACKRLIALSDCTRQIQSIFLEDHPAFAGEINRKVSVLQPPQAPLLDAEAVEVKLNQRHGTRSMLKCLFIGADFFRKGGLELLQAFDILIQQKYPVHLSIVSGMHYGDYASQSTHGDLTTAMRLIQKHPQHIQLHHQLPTLQVMELCRDADVGLLPTWADTYGYSALEFMAAGCPLLSTDIRALPEINGTDRGWIISTAKDRLGNAELSSVTQRRSFSNHLQNGILEAMTTILQSPDQIRTKGQAAYRHILEHHAPLRAAAQMEIWYDEALT
jgi:glycosyltransferase involved in cell wall biosynthesis